MSGILVIAEQRRGELRPVSLELLGAAQSLRRPGDEVAVAVLSAAPDRFAAALSVAGVDEILTVKTASPEFDADTFESAVGALIAARQPQVVLVAHSVDSFGYAAALAARLGLGFATDVFKAERIDGDLVATRMQPPYALATDPALVEGAHTITVEASDGDGNTTTEQRDIVVAGPLDPLALGCSAGKHAPGGVFVLTLAAFALVRRRRRVASAL